MALAVTEPVAEVADTTNTTTYTTGSFTPTADSLLVVFVNALGTVATGSVSGGSLTWVREVAVIPLPTHTSNAHWIYWAQVGGSPGSITISFSCAGDTSTGCMIQVFQVTGHDTGSPVVQAKAGMESSTPTPTFTLDNNMTTTSAYMYAVFNASSNTVTPPAGWTEVTEASFATPALNMEAAYRIGGLTNNTILPVQSGAGNINMMFIEIRLAGAIVSIKRLMLMGVG